MKKLLAAALTAVMLAGGAGVAVGAPGGNGNGKAGPGHGNNGYGLCTAYFNGQKKGHNGGSPPPFAALEEDAEEWADPNNEDSTPATPQEIWDYCVASYGTPGGNPENGRFPTVND